jgi:anti-anti-sigma factor
MTEAHLPVRTRREGEAVVVAVGGELDLATVPVFLEAVHSSLGVGDVRVLVLDLLDLGFMDSSGLGAVLSVKDEHPYLDLRLVVGDGVVDRLLTTTAMHKRLTILTSVAEALG